MPVGAAIRWDARKQRITQKSFGRILSKDFFFSNFAVLQSRTVKTYVDLRISPIENIRQNRIRFFTGVALAVLLMLELAPDNKTRL